VLPCVKEIQEGAPLYVDNCCVAVCCSVLQCVAVCCSVLQCVERIQEGQKTMAPLYVDNHCVAVCRSLLQCVALCCSVLQRVVVC